jgi:hypothetical protein
MLGDLGSELDVLRRLGVVSGAFLSLEQLSEFLGGRPKVPTLYRWARRGKIPVRNHNGLLVAYIPEILEWSASQAKKELTNKKTSVSKFREVQARLRSLKTENAVSSPIVQRGVG